MNPSSAISRLSFAAAAAAMTAVLFASAGSLARMERETAVAQFAPAAVASQAQVLVAAGTPSGR